MRGGNEIALGVPAIPLSRAPRATFTCVMRHRERSETRRRAVMFFHYHSRTRARESRPRSSRSPAGKRAPVCPSLIRHSYIRTTAKRVVPRFLGKTGIRKPAPRRTHHGRKRAARSSSSEAVFISPGIPRWLSSAFSSFDPFLRRRVARRRRRKRRERGGGKR